MMQAANFSRQDTQPRLEPTQVAGFNQLFPGPEAEEAWRYGVGVDQRLSENLYAGAEFSRRDLDTPRIFLGPTDQVFFRAVEEDSRRAYVYWAPSLRLAVSAVYRHDEKDNDEPATLTPGQEINVRTHRLPLSLNYFHPRGLSAGFTASFVDQKGSFWSAAPPLVVGGEDQFWVLDAFLGYRLPNRHGIVTLNVGNLLDDEFRFQDIDPENTRIAPERLVLLKFTLAL